MKKMKQTIAIALLMLLAVGCNDKDRTKEVVVPIEDQQPVNPGMVKNASFEVAESGLIVGWQFRHHAKSDSYLLTSANGVARIERIGNEPWASLVQTFSTKELESAIGQRLRFTVELKADFNSHFGEPTFSSGASLLVKGVPVGTRWGEQLIDEQKVVLEPYASFGWRQLMLDVKMPSAEEVGYLKLEILITMSSGGSIFIRNPSLQIINSDHN